MTTTTRTNNAITEDLVRIRDGCFLSSSDRDALADAANRIQQQGKALALNARTAEEWLATEHTGHNVHDHEHQGAFDHWKNELKAAFMAGRNSAPRPEEEQGT